MAKCSVSTHRQQSNLQLWNYFYFCFCYLLYLLSKWKKKTLLEDIALLIIFLMNFFERKDKNTRHYSISYKNYCSKWIAEDFGYVKVHEIALLLVPGMLSYNFFLGWHVFKINMTTLHVFMCMISSNKWTFLTIYKLVIPYDFFS